MPQRKVWSAEQDKILKLLVEVRGIIKWSQISRIMQEEFKIIGRNGKQCRQRYHNHLADNIKNQEWTAQEQDILFQLQDEVGNKWAMISCSLPGRTDNCVKNHFYSKLRKNLRKINKKINKYFKKQYREIKTSTLYKMIQTLQNKNKNGQNIEISIQNYEICKKIKHELRIYQEQILKYETFEQQMLYIRNIIEHLVVFDKDIKKINKKQHLKLSGSGKISVEKTISNDKSAKLVSSTRSLYDDDSSISNSNSQMFSQSSLKFNQNSIKHLYITRPTNIFGSQRIQPRNTLQVLKDQKAQISLYNSANINSKKIELDKQQNIMSQFLRQQLKKQQRMSIEGSISSSQSSSSEQNYKYLIEQQSYMLNISTPPVLGLTASQIRQLHQEKDQWPFNQEMKLDQQQNVIVKNFQKINLSIPRLGMDQF